MTSIRLVNTTTTLRVDGALERGFFRVMHPAFLAAVEKQSRHDFVDVQLAHRRPPKGGMNRIPDTDALGTYVSHNPITHHPVIEVFPERVLAACAPWSTILGDELPFAERYPALLNNVIVHELAHYLMDDRSFSDHYCRVRSWSGNIGWLQDNANTPLANEWADEPVPDSEGEQWMHKQMQSRAHVCEIKAKSLQDWNEKNAVWVSILNEHLRIVEESLANALVLRQMFGRPQLKALELFVESQSEPYKAGLKWHGNLVELLDMASTWRRFKSDVVGPEHQGWPDAPSAQKQWLDELVNGLLSPEGVVLPFGVPGESLAATVAV
jgi:hypothetical protein